jgi:uncharacterized membrane protein YvbJ
MAEVQQNPALQTVANTPVMNTINTANTEEGSVYNYVVMFIVAAVLILLIWYSYSKFVENSSGPNEEVQEKDEAVADYDLKEELRELQKMQNNNLKDVTQDVGI